MSQLGTAVDQVKTYAKNKVKKELFKIAFKLLKKLLAKAVMIIGKLLLSAAGLLGVKAIIAILVIVIVGGAVMYVMPFFGWFSGDSKSPKTPEQLRTEYLTSVMATSSNEEYRPPQLLIQFIDNIRILKEDKELWEIDPLKVTRFMKADITKKSFTNTTITTRTKLSSTDESESPSDDEEPEVKKSSSEVDLVIKAHTWDRIEEITYEQKTTNSSYTTTDSEGNEYSVEVERTTWIESSRASTPDFSKLDQTLMDLKFNQSDFDLLIDTIIANNEDYLAGYNGSFGMVYGDDIGWWEDGEIIITDGDWLWPTVSTRITSGFYIRKHPVTGETAMHTGIDIGRPIIDGKFDERAQPILSVADGIVTFAGTKGSYGTVVFVNHGNGLESIYGHLKSIDKSVSIGSQVKAGSVIGIMGSTGRSTGVHLHFSVKNNGKYDNPLKYLKVPG